MRCYCGGNTCVIDTRPQTNMRVRRRRKCRKCGARFSTVEVEARTLTALIKCRDALDRLYFDRAKWGRRVEDHGDIRVAR
jgi:transcriptional regulator NrdR family protein